MALIEFQKKKKKFSPFVQSSQRYSLSNCIVLLLHKIHFLFHYKHRFYFLPYKTSIDHAVANWQSYQNDHDEIDKLEDDVEMKEEVGIKVLDNFKESSNSDYNQWQWLKILEVKETRESVPIASIVANRMNREEIRANFYFYIQEPMQQTCKLAYDLFAYWRYVKDDFLHHLIKSGMGVWGNGLNEGEILLFESIIMDKNFRK